MLRTNALAITGCPSQCATVKYSGSITFQEINDKVREHRPAAIVAYTDRVLFWGAPDEVYKVIEKEKVTAIEPFRFEDPNAAISDSGIIKSFFERALAESLCNEKPLMLRRKGKTHYAVINHLDVGSPLLEPLKAALGNHRLPGYLTGSVPKLSNRFWAEALSIKLEERNGLLWLLVRPDIWIKPLAAREEATDFLRSKKLLRYNAQSCQLLDAWIELLFGTVGEGQEASVSCFSDTDYSPKFTVNTRTAFSRGRGSNG